jgi:alpha-D-ribose 1-methylphosphonate 5-triphosphate synthase subunit PhnG
MRQSEGWEAAARAALVALADDHQRQAALDARRSGATKVQFFTMTRSREQK